MFFDNPNSSMVAISIFSSGLAVAVLYLLANAMFNRTTGVAASLFLTTSPLFWFYGEIALPHSLDAFLVIACALLLYAAQKNRTAGYWAAGLTAAAGGFRPQTLVFLLPLLLYTVLRYQRAQIFRWAAIGVLVCLAWFIPLITLSGGLQSYLSILSQFSDRFQSSTSVFSGAGLPGLVRNGAKLSLYTAYGLGFCGLGLIGFLVRVKSIAKQSMNQILFLAIWMAPVLMYYLLVHMGQQGLVFVFLPALIILAGVGILSFFSIKPNSSVITLGLIITMNAAVFLLLPEYPLGKDQQRFLTRDTIVQNDAYFLEKLSTLQQQFEDGPIAVIASNWRHLQFYLPGVPIIGVEPEQKWETSTGNLLLKQEEPLRSLAWLSELSQSKASTRLFVVDLNPDELFNFAIPAESYKISEMSGMYVVEFFQSAQFGLQNNRITITQP
ncbi:MAG: hypothetical protein GYA48_12730 [Chloroflexi bacterium]|nr:hypothetical protein [Chloroflexota bacterium]